jgi:sugar lactone lactonase YvrE
MTDGSAPPRQLVNQDCTGARFAPDGEIYFTGGEHASSYLQAVKPDGTGLHKVTPEKALFLYDVSPDGKWAAVWSGDKTAIDLYPIAGGAAIRLCERCAGAGAEERGLTPPIVSWSHDGKEMYLYSERSLATYVVPLKAGQEVPAAAASRIAWINEPPLIPGMRTIPHQRAFMSGDPSVYAYTQVSAHRNIYRIRVP